MMVECSFLQIPVRSTYLNATNHKGVGESYERRIVWLENLAVLNGRLWGSYGPFLTKWQSR